MYEALDFYYQGIVDSQFMVGFMVMHMTEGSLETKFGEFFSTFSKDKKKQSDPQTALPIIDLFQQVLALLNNQ